MHAPNGEAIPADNEHFAHIQSSRHANSLPFRYNVPIYLIHINRHTCITSVPTHTETLAMVMQWRNCLEVVVSFTTGGIGRG
jgi:hypothetical protein